MAFYKRYEIWTWKVTVSAGRRSFQQLPPEEISVGIWGRKSIIQTCWRFMEHGEKLNRKCFDKSCIGMMATIFPIDVRSFRGILCLVSKLLHFENDPFNIGIPIPREVWYATISMVIRNSNLKIISNIECAINTTHTKI